jgi:N-acetylneuraminic acid mutarotase
MNFKRANFSCLAVQNFVYVYGGISSGSTGGEAHRPILASMPIERFMPASNEWEELKIVGVPRLAAFSWCKIDEGSIVVLGGSDGNLLSSDMMIIDFKEEKVKHVQTDFDFSTGCGHLVFRKSDSTLLHIGGFNSEGVNYQMKLGDPRGLWSES